MKNKIHMLKYILMVLIFTLAIPLQAQAIDYYVDQNHPSANDQNSGTMDRPWKTITKANQTLVAGDTVYIKAGTYNSYIAPNNSGTSSNRITYRNYGSDTVTISNTTYGILLSGKSYITVQGINFYLLDQFLWTSRIMPITIQLPIAILTKDETWDGAVQQFMEVLHTTGFIIVGFQNMATMTAMREEASLTLAMRNPKQTSRIIISLKTIQCFMAGIM